MVIVSHLLTHSDIVNRYRHAGRLYHKEYRFWLMGDITDRLVLDVGCGSGMNAVLLSTLGARVVGVDISPQAVKLAQRRAELSGQAGRCKFICSPLELAHNFGGPFDIVWGDAILHHLIAELPATLDKLVGCTKRGGLHVYSEPVNFCHALRALRKLIPIKTDATPDERPLEVTEIDMIRQFLPDLTIVPFHLLGRFHRFLESPAGGGHRFDRLKRLANYGLATTDRLLLGIPLMDRFAGYAVLHGRVQHH